MKMKRMSTASLCVLAIGSVFAGDDDRPWTIVNLDNNYYQNCYSAEEMTVEAIDRCTDGYLEGPVTHLFVNAQGMRSFYPSKVLEPIWDTFNEPGAITNVGWLCKAKLLNDKGIDLYAQVLKRARAHKGVEGWISMRMNDIHGVEDPRTMTLSQFWLRRPDLWRVPFDSSRNYPPRAFDYAHKEVRDLYLAAARELFERYDMDGLDADWTRFPWYLTPGKEKELAYLLTDFMREIRKMANEFAAKRGHPIRVCATVLSSPEANERVGTDPVRWAKEGLVDALFFSCFFWEVDFATPFAEWKKLVGAANPKVRLGTRVDTGIVLGFSRKNLSFAEYCGYFERLMEQGCRDFCFFNFFNYPHFRTNPDPLWTFAIAKGGGITPERVRARTRAYPASYRDGHVIGLSQPWWPFGGAVGTEASENPDAMPYRPFKTCPIEIGRATNVGKVFVEAGFLSAPETPPELTLNGVRPLKVTVDRTANWCDGKQVKVVYCYKYPPSALKDGLNEVGYPDLGDIKARGCEIRVEPR